MCVCVCVCDLSTCKMARSFFDLFLSRERERERVGSDLRFFFESTERGVFFFSFSR